MEQKTYLVVVGYLNTVFKPTVVEEFDNEADANSYAALMCRVKHRKYTVFEQKTEWDGTPQEK